VIIAVYAVVTVAILLIAYGIGHLKDEQRIQMPENFQQDYSKRFDIASRKANIINFLAKKLSFLTNFFIKFPYFLKLRDQTEVLRMNIDFSKFILFKVIFMILAATSTGILLSPAFVLVGAFVGFFGPDFFVWNKVKEKKEAIDRIFPETIDLLDMCINAGADFLSAIKWVVEKSQTNPFIEQLSVVLSEVQVGKSRSEALKDMSRRLNLPDINSFVRTIIQSERMGTSIEEAFRNLSEDTREKRFRNGERLAIKASLKILFPLLFCILPAIMIVVAGPIIIKFSSGELMPKNF